MNTDQLFPFENVPQGSRVIIYGYGMWGRSYIEQINKTKWCNIVGVIDKNARNVSMVNICDISICSQKKLYDYIVIAISDYKVILEIILNLEKYGVSRNQIIYRNDIINDEAVELIDTVNNEKRLVVLIKIMGGIGDGIMATALYNRIVMMAPDVIIDIYGESYYDFIYRNKSNVRRVIDYHKEDINYDEYDVALQTIWGVKVLACNYTELEKKSPQMYDAVLKSYEIESEYGKVGKSLENAYKIKTALVNKKDKFWLRGFGNVWNLSCDLMTIELYPEYIEEYNKLRLKNYITINSDADRRRFKSDNDIANKVWPVSYCNEFVKLFKSKYSNIKVVQVGANNSPTIEDTDYCFLGKPLELVEYILKNAFLHIDDEGGLVHMATALGTKCAVLFGPTPVGIFGYEQNINICADTCKECFGIVPYWDKCCINYEYQKKCMYDITPDMVIDRISEYMDDVCKEFSDNIK
jgi:ADP-heptose:LPS heptosyltransferase